jgi:hypothetical protein
MDIRQYAPTTLSVTQGEGGKLPFSEVDEPAVSVYKGLEMETKIVLKESG